MIGVDGAALLVAADDGTRFRIPVDEVLQARLRQTSNAPSTGTERKLTPREIQGHIRGGMSAEDVAAITGASLEYIQRFEGPVLAEREYVVESALAVPVHTAADTDPLSQSRSFGEVIRERLHDLGAVGERWASWKEDGSGWIVKLAFTADQVDHDARWSYDPKRQALAPLGNEAIMLSQQGSASGPLIPRLRAVAPAEPTEHTRFDSGAFTTTDDASTGPMLEPVAFGRTAPASASASDDDSESTGHQTADLLDALRRRRGEREAAGFGDENDARAAHPSTGSIRLIDVPLPEPEPDESQRATAPQPVGRGSRKGRAAMPSWDEIVFGTRPDDDPA